MKRRFNQEGTSQFIEVVGIAVRTMKDRLEVLLVQNDDFAPGLDWPHLHFCSQSRGQRSSTCDSDPSKKIRLQVMLQVLFLLLVTPILSLTCNSGTAASLSVVPINCTTISGSPFFQDSCISAKFNTPLTPPYGSDVYFCGNCAAFSNPPLSLFASNVSCCQNDTCQTIAPAPPAGTCNSFITSATCAADPACYWCGAPSIFGFIGICQSLSGLTCWGAPLFVPKPICSSVTCAPFQGPPYTVNELTLDYLLGFGYSAITSTLSTLFFLFLSFFIDFSTFLIARHWWQ
jgi:hypothetical protein